VAQIISTFPEIAGLPEKRADLQVTGRKFWLDFKVLWIGLQQSQSDIQRLSTTFDGFFSVA
jgi:hypothetical protein